MKTKYFTIADGPYFGYMAQELSHRLKRVHGIDLTVITDDMARIHNCMNRQYWLKAYLWDFAGNADRIMYFDSDILLVEPLDGPRVLQSGDFFSARLDVEATAISQRAQHPYFSRIRNYFNNGFFIAYHDSQFIFNALKKQQDNPIHGSCIEQTWMNKIVDESDYSLNILPTSTCWMPKGEPRPVGSVSMIHYAGYNAPEKLIRFMADKDKYNV